MCLLAVLVFGSSVRAEGEGSAAPDYVKQVAPILKKYCAGCHNNDDREGKLSLESFAELNKGGERGAAIVPGQATSSRLIRVLTGDAKPKMPPEDNEAPNESELAILRAWVDLGAKGPEGEEPRVLVTPRVPAARGSKAITAVAMSPEGTLLAVARFAEVELRAIGGVLRTIGPLDGKVHAVHFSADGSRLVTASGVTGLRGVASIWNVVDGTLIREFTAHRDTLYDAELSPDGKLLATCSYDRKVILWNAETGEQLRTLDGHNDAIYDVAFSPDGTVLATASGDETAKLWQVETGMRLDTLHQPQAEQYVVTFSPDGKYVLAGGADNRIRVWRFVSTKQRRINPLVYARFAHEGAVVALAFSRDGKSLLSASEDRTVKLWETNGYTQVHLYEPQSDDVAGLAVSPLEDAITIGRLDGSLASYPIPASSARPTDSTTAVAAAVSTPMSKEMSQGQDTEPNDNPDQATSITAPARISGVIHPTREGQTKDVDLYKFAAKARQQWMIEINAARQKSPLDSKVEVVDAQGNPIQRVLLRAVRDSYFTFRGQNSNTSDGFRLHNWEEMDINQFLYSDGEVSKLWHYPRGPDSGFTLYPGRGKRFAYFDTTAMSHPLQAPCYIVEAHPPGTQLIPNGLPSFPVYYENDDESRRRFGADSLLSFTAPRDGEYLVRVSDARGFSGEDHKYELIVRPRNPSFKVALGGANPTVHAGSGKEFTVTADRIDGFEGAIRVDIEGLPPGFHVSTPLTIEAGQTQAIGTINASPDAPALTPENAKATKVTAAAMIAGLEVKNDVNNFGEIKLADQPKVLVTLLSSDVNAPQPTKDKPLELVIAPGQTITARVRVERHGDFKGRVSFGNADSGRNLPHGVYVDNIGLNGLLVVEGQDERTFFVTAAGVAPETTRTFHLRATVEGNQTSWPVILHVRRNDSIAGKPE
jgi:WD40 repeat protein